MSPVLRFEVSLAGSTPSGGDPTSDIIRLGSVLDKLRDEMCSIDEKMLLGEIALPPSKQPLHAGFANLPAQLLSEYEAGRPVSQLGRMLAVTKQLMTEVDRVVVLADREFLIGARALMRACCQPHFNELSRGDRGSRPRLSFVGGDLDNDSVQGMLHLVGAHRQRSAENLEQRWGLVVIAGSRWPGSAGRVCAAFAQALHVNCGGDAHVARARSIVIANQSSPGRKAVDELLGAHQFCIPDNVGARYSVLSLAGLIPAALVGMNIMKLLEGARAMQTHFASTKAVDNLVLQYAAINHVFEVDRQSSLRHWCLWSERLQALAEWYQQLVRDSCGQMLALQPPAALDDVCAGNTSAGSSTGGEVSKDHSVLHQVIASHYRFDPLPVVSSAEAEQSVESRSVPYEDWASGAKNLVEASQAALVLTQQRLAAAGRSATQLVLPQVDEPSVGQLLQWLMLSSVVEARLRGRNPYS